MDQRNRQREKGYNRKNNVIYNRDNGVISFTIEKLSENFTVGNHEETLKCRRVACGMWHVAGLCCCVV